MDVSEIPLLSKAGVLIVGGGLVGASLAIALDAAGIPATLVETAAPRAEAQPSYDERNLALARATVNGLESIGVWRHAAAGATPIRHIHVSRAGEFGSARITATSQGVDALGWTLPARELGAALLRRLDKCTRLTRLAPATLSALQPLAEGWRAQISTADGVHHLDTPLLVGADGTHSFVRAQLGIEAEQHDYQQCLFVCTVTPAHEHSDRAYERFADDGPIALLPLAERRCGWRLGRLSRPGKRHPYAIHRVAAAQLTAPRAVLIGNAAQTVHPIGAQGFNLGLRDALTLAELVASAGDPGDAGLLASYAARRAPDRDGTMAMSHGLVQLACLPQPLLAPLRSLALLTCDRLPPLQRALARRGMGFRGEPPLAVLERLP
jgi:2-octaprenyl-6-methoxyphenol hydroxylase